VNGIKEKDAVIFTGSGSTGAISKLAHILNLIIPRDLDHKYNLSSYIPDSERPVVFVGPYEHHSNELIWRESIADVVTIPETYDGTVDVNVLEEQVIIFMYLFIYIFIYYFYFILFLLFIHILFLFIYLYIILFILYYFYYLYIYYFYLFIYIYIIFIYLFIYNIIHFILFLLFIYILFLFI